MCEYRSTICFDSFGSYECVWQRGNDAKCAITARSTRAHCIHKHTLAHKETFSPNNRPERMSAVFDCRWLHSYFVLCTLLIFLFRSIYYTQAHEHTYTRLAEIVCISYVAYWMWCVMCIGIRNARCVIAFFLLLGKHSAQRYQQYCILCSHYIFGNPGCLFLFLFSLPPSLSLNSRITARANSIQWTYLFLDYIVAYILVCV